jgi:hypothetical protein
MSQQQTTNNNQITDLVNPSEEKTPKKQLSPRAVFAIRFTAFILFAFLLPIGHILGKYKPFNYTESLSVGFAGLVIIAILFIGLKFLVEFYLNGVKTKYSLAKQIVSGVTKVIVPMCAVVALVIVLSKYTQQLLDMSIVLIPCEMVAIVVNPLPKWAFDNNVEGLANITEKILDVVQTKKDKDK